MKMNELSKSKRKKFKSVARILTIAVCFSVAFSLVTVETSEAILGIAIVVVGAFVAGAIIGWIAGQGHDRSPPDALVTSQENYVAVWNDFIEEWNNDYISENINLHNYMMMYNLTYLDSVRRAEHDVASYVHLTDWSDVEDAMSSLTDYKQNVTNFIVSTLHGYNRVDVSILQHMYDTDGWEYTTPMKYGLYFYLISDPVRREWMDLFQVKRGDTRDCQYRVEFGTYPVGFNGNYDVGDKFYVTFLYVPDGQNIVLENLDSNIQTTYTQGVHDLQGEKNEVISVTRMGMCLGGADPINTVAVYLFGVPTDFDILEDTHIYYDTALTPVSGTSTTSFETSKYVTEITLEATDTAEAVVVDVYVNGVFKLTRIMYTTSDTIAINEMVTNITTITESPEEACVSKISSEGYIYHDMTGGLKVVTEYGGTADVTDNLPDRGRIGLDWMVDSYKSIYNSMVINAQILWNLYHDNGWYTTGDIPSEFLVVAPDMIFDNIDVLENLPMDKALAIYYAWMAQLIDFYNENPDYTGTYDDTNMTVFDDGIIINATLIHGGKTIFSNHQIYISPLLGDFHICKDNSYNLTQKIFIYDITANYVYYGYVGDNLTVHSITIDDVGADCVTLGRQTMHDFLMGKYGFSISFPAEWVFPGAGEPIEIYGLVGVALICLGVPIWIFAGKKFNKIGIVMALIGSVIVIYIYVLPAILDFFKFW